MTSAIVRNIVYRKMDKDDKAIFKSILDKSDDPFGFVKYAGDCMLASDKHGWAFPMKGYHSLHLCKYIEFEDYDKSTGVIVVDIDKPDAEAILASNVNNDTIQPPSYYIKNAENGHVQAGWLYDSFKKDGSLQSKKLKALVNNVTRCLTKVLQGDRCFSHHRFKNPYDVDAWDVFFPVYEDDEYPGLLYEFPFNIAGSACRKDGFYDRHGVVRYSLRKMADWLDAAGVYDNGESALHSRRLVTSVINACMGEDALTETAVSDYVPGDMVQVGERNVTVFSAAVKAARAGQDADAAARAVQCEQPLSDNEIRGIVKSAVKSAKVPLSDVISGAGKSAPKCSVSSVLPPETRGVLSELGHRGGTANTARQVQSRKANLERGRMASMRTRMNNRDRVLESMSRLGPNLMKALRVTGRISAPTLKHVAELLGLSVATVRRCIADIVVMLKRGYAEFVRTGRVTRKRMKEVQADARKALQLYGRRESISCIIHAALADGVFRWFALKGWSYIDGDDGNAVIAGQSCIDDMFRGRIRDISNL